MGRGKGAKKKPRCGYRCADPGRNDRGGDGGGGGMVFGARFLGLVGTRHRYGQKLEPTNVDLR